MTQPRRRQRRGDHRRVCSSPSSSATCRGRTSTSPGRRRPTGDAVVAHRRAAPGSAPGCWPNSRVDFAAPDPMTDDARSRCRHDEPAAETADSSSAMLDGIERVGNKVPAPGDHLPRSGRAGDRPVGGPRRASTSASPTTSSSQPPVAVEEVYSAGRSSPETVADARRLRRAGVRRRPGDHVDPEPARRATASASSSRRSSTTSPASASSPSMFVAMIGVGVAEEAGLMGALIRKLVTVAPREALDVHHRVRRRPVERRHRRRLPDPHPARRGGVPQRRPASAGRARRRLRRRQRAASPSTS